MQMGMDFSILSLLCVLPVLLISLALSVFWVWMLVDCLVNEASEGNDKIVWAAIIFFASPLLGAPLYFFIRRPRRIEELGR